MLTVPDHTLATRSRSRVRGGREDEQERASAPVGLGLGAVPLVAGFLHLGQQEPGSAGTFLQSSRPQRIFGFENLNLYLNAVFCI